MQKKPQDLLDREAARAAVHRDNLLLSRHNKRNYSSDDDSNADWVETEDEQEFSTGTIQPQRYREDEEESPANQEVRAVRTIRSMRKKSRRQDTQKKDESTDMALVGALNGLGARIGGAMEQLVAASVIQGEERQAAPLAAANDETAREEARKALLSVERVNGRLDEFETVIKKENSETKDLLRMVLARLPATSGSL